MQVLVGGSPAVAEVSTVVWQYRQSTPIPPTWCWWLNGTGCSRATPACVTYPERLISAIAKSDPTTRKRAPKMLTFERVLVLRWNVCGIGLPDDDSGVCGRSLSHA